MIPTSDLVPEEKTLNTLPSLNRTTLRGQALATLRESIVSGAIPGDTRLSEVELATRLGVSRGTVREALRSLQQSGLVVGGERVGLRVRRLNSREVRELFSVRGALEGQAAVDVMGAANPADLIDELEKALPPEDGALGYLEHFEFDLAFHEALCRASGNGILLSMWQSAKDLMRMTVASLPEDRLRTQMSRGNHAPLIVALRSGDPDRARRELHEHMEIAADKWEQATV